MPFLLFALKYLVLTILTLAIGLFSFINLSAVFGGQADTATLAHMAKMSNYQDGRFDNLETIIRKPVPESEQLGLVDFFVNIFNPADGKHPTQPLPTLPLSENLPTENNRFTWLGHSTVLFKMGDKTLITDPVFYRVSPIPVGGLPYPMTNLPATSDLPAIDIVLISHDHYDHLDMKAVTEIHERVSKFIVPLGVKSHLVRWGVNPDKITELGWHEKAVIDGLELIYVPAHHYGGRNIGTKGTSLWGGWVVKSFDFSLYYTGDSGYGKHFSDIAKRYAPKDGFDLMLVENGAYNINWSDIHMMPEQSVQAVIDAKARLALPVHWGKYDLAYHPWSEPAQRFTKEADAKGVRYITPQIGENFGTDDSFDKWWEQAK